MVRIVAVVPIRSGSQRVPNKNARPFSNTTLLENKLYHLLQLRDVLSDVVVNSDCDEYLQVAHRLGFNTHKRDKYYASSGCPASEYFRHLGEVTDADVIMLVTVTAPFLSPQTLRKAVEVYCDRCLGDAPQFDSVATAEFPKEFFWWKGQPLNYHPEKAPNSQELGQDICRLSFGTCIIAREKLLQYSHVVGKKPYFMKVDQLEGIDIDTFHDFVLAEGLFRQGIRTMKDAEETAKAGFSVVGDPLQGTAPILLDCTIRDGGYRTDWKFDAELVAASYRACEIAGVGIFEVGFMQVYDESTLHGQWCYSKPDLVNSTLRQWHRGKTKVSIMIRAEWGTTHIPDQQCWCVDIVRVLFKYPLSIEYLQEGIQTCNVLKSKGYIIHMNFARGGHLVYGNF